MAIVQSVNGQRLVMCDSGDGSWHPEESMIRLHSGNQYRLADEKIYFPTYLRLFEKGADAVLWSHEFDNLRLAI